jgi:hypothetical protein
MMGTDLGKSLWDTLPTLFADGFGNKYFTNLSNSILRFLKFAVHLVVLCTATTLIVPSKHLLGALTLGSARSKECTWI